MGYDSAMSRAEDLIRSVSGGVTDISNKYEPDYMLYLLDLFRAAAISELFNSKGRTFSLHYSLMQEYVSDKDDSIQVVDPIKQTYCAVRFDVPQILMINELINGVGYVGGTDGLSPYRVVRSRQELSEQYMHPIMKPSSERVYVLTDANGNFEVHGNDAIDQLLINAAFSQPTQVPGFNVDLDRYPVDDAVMARMKEIARKLSLDYIAGTPEDRIQDFQVQLSRLKQQIVIK